jgi:predicted amidohydrolase YtcJ
VTALVLRGARVIGDPQVVDVVLESGRLTAIGRALEAPAAAEVIDLDGRWVMPGLWDAHVHFTQWARFRGRIDVAGSRSAAEAASRLATAALRSRASVIVGRGFQDALWPDAMTADALDLACGGRPVVVISHDLHSVWLNSSAAARFGAPHAGLLREEAAFAVQIALDAETTPAEDDALVRAAATEAAARGIVGIRDLEMADNVTSWAQRVAAGLDSLRVEACIYPPHLAASDARGLLGGDIVPATHGLVTVGGVKVFADGSLNTRTAFTHEPYGHAGGEQSVGHAAHSLEGLVELLSAANDRGLPVALHAIGDAAVTRALDAFEATGAWGTIEHAQLVAPRDLPRFAALGIAASVQPRHAIDDRDVTDAVWGDRAHRAFPYRSLLNAGAELLLGSDAPVAPLDPWVTIAAAVHRSGDDREPWQPQEQLSPGEAIAASVRSRVAVGEPADLIAVDHDPLESPSLGEMPVSLTVLGGRVTHSRL